MKVRRWPRRWPSSPPCGEAQSSSTSSDFSSAMRLRFREYCRYHMGAAACGPSSSASCPVSVSQVHLMPQHAKYSSRSSSASQKLVTNQRHVLAGYNHPTISCPTACARNGIRFASTNQKPKDDATKQNLKPPEQPTTDTKQPGDGPTTDDKKTFQRKRTEKQLVQARERPSWWRRMYSYVTWNISQYPVVVAVCSSGLLIGAGDATSQVMLEDGSVDFKRVAARCSGSMVLYGVIFCRFYRWLSGIDRFFPVRYAKFALPTKVALDSLFATPIIFLPWFYCWMGYWYDEMGVRDSLLRWRTNVVRDTMAACVVYVPGQFLNFYFIPLTYRIIAMNVQDFSYSVGFAYLNGRSASPDDPPRRRRPISESDFPDLGLAFQEDDDLRIHRRLTTETIARVHRAFSRRRTTHHIPQPIAQEDPPPVQAVETNAGPEPADAAEISVPIVYGSVCIFAFLVSMFAA